MQISRARLMATAIAIACCTATAHAQAEPAQLEAAPTGSDQAISPTVEAGIVQSVSAPASQAFSIAAVDDSALRQVTGREDTGTMIASSTQRNTVSNNSVTGNSVTGSVQIDGNAFQNLQGLAVINANSGNNVAINSSMNVTVNLAPR